MKRALALSLCLAAAACLAAEPQRSEAPRSGFDFMSPATQAMQRDDSANPGMLWVQDGARLWEQPAGAAQRACAACHDKAAQSMRGVAARYPAFDAQSGAPVALAQRINQCRQTQQRAAPWAAESQELLAMEAFVALQSRGLPLAPPADPRLQPARELGERLYRQRLGQLDLSCAQCHDGRAGQRLGGSVIPQAHANAYPVYRLEWQTLGSLQRRLRNCMSGVRAEPFAYGAPELVALELYLNARDAAAAQANRSAALAMEAPGVRP
ncbi:MAG TPA: sulfur oxidation c-type cytochrome SoxA [Ideonella sp.]|nr:sulfur oxidation c-type cytochrome SoxA [Ideonella sp.]